MIVSPRIANKSSTERRVDGKCMIGTDEIATLAVVSRWEVIDSLEQECELRKDAPMCSTKSKSELDTLGWRIVDREKRV